MLCPRCGVMAPEGARFCEACGASLTPPAASAPAPDAGRCRCGAGPEAKEEAGYCSVCGLRWQPSARAALPRDHVELVVTPVFAAVTDRGRRHSCNEDDVALAQEDVAGQTPCSVLVVCDGVSSSQHADEASAAAVRAACAFLGEALRRGEPQTSGAAMRGAIVAGHEAACALPSVADHPKGPPGTTLVAALVRDGRATLGWVGDSRAYWIGSSDARLLTHDHSWVNEVVDAGEMTEEEALRAPDAHAITRCLGPLNEDRPNPSLVSVPLSSPGWLLLCSDGLWNYAPHVEQIAALVRQAPSGVGAVERCRQLVDYALAQGGRDNITVAMLAVV